MTDLNLDNLDELYEMAEYQEALPDHVALDPYHPDNDEYTKTERRLRALCVTAAKKMRPKHVDIITMHVLGTKNADICQKVGLGSATVSKVLNDPKNDELKAILHHLNRHREGATLNHRKGILYRIAIDNEQNRPNTSISAIQEINKMTGVYQEQSTPNKIQIVINNELLPRTVLDHDGS